MNQFLLSITKALNNNEMLTLSLPLVQVNKQSDTRTVVCLRSLSVIDCKELPVLTLIMSLSFKIVKFSNI